MLPFRRVLLPLDYSDAGQAVIPFAKDVLARFDAELTLVHAFGPESLGYVDLPITNPEIAVEARQVEQNRIHEFAEKHFPGRKAECVIELGEPGWVIEQVVESRGTDLVMLATHGRGRLRRALLGSVTMKVLHDISAAVWTSVGSAAEGHQPAPPYKSIVCAVDQGEETDAVLVAAAAMAKAYQAQLTVLHAVDVPHMTFEVDFSPLLKDVRDAAQESLRETKARLGIDAPQRVENGVPAEVIRSVAAELKADLVITGRGRVQGSFSRLWSHLYSIVRESPCPVLSI